MKRFRNPLGVLSSGDSLLSLRSCWSSNSVTRTAVGLGRACWIAARKSILWAAPCIKIQLADRRREFNDVLLGSTLPRLISEAAHRVCSPSVTAGLPWLTCLLYSAHSDLRTWQHGRCKRFQSATYRNSVNWAAENTQDR